MVYFRHMFTQIFDHAGRGYHHMNRFFAKHKTYSAFLFIIFIGFLFVLLFSSPKNEKETYTIALTPLKQYVKVTGQVQSSKDANLAFQVTGSVEYLAVKTGDVVPQGKVLATLSGGDARASVLQAEASLDGARATLASLEQGPRKEELAVKEQALEGAKNTLDQVYTSLPDSIQNVDAVTSDVVKNKFSSFFMIQSGNYELTFASCNQKLQGEIEAKRTALEATLADFQKKSTLVTTISQQDTVDSAFSYAYKSAIATNDLVNAISNLLLLPCSISNTSLDSARTALSSVKTSMTTMFSDITAKRSSLTVAKNTYSQALRDLELARAGSDPYKIKSQASLVSQAEAQVVQAKANLSKTMITAPFSGVVSDVGVSLGETAQAGKTVISMLAVDSYEIEAKVPEIDLIKVKVGQEVEVTLDAYGKDQIFKAVVTRINPTATIEGSVPMYKVIVTFTGKDERVRQGMTANVGIITEQKEKVVTVPARFVSFTNQTNGKVTLFTKEKNEIEKEITVGARGDDGAVEVLSGLVTGDVVVMPTTKSRSADKGGK